ncbi:MAG: hypothetical protein J5531_07870, partial [Lachnospiraceae bacterium]|nr:hypothetical protein [Lachnospiraceae bacterium]
MKLFVAIVMLLFMPACAMFFLGAYSRKEKTKTGFLYLISVIATAVVTLVLAKGILPEWTIYEVSACAGIAAIVLTFAVALFNKKIKFSVDTVLRTICFISIITAVYSILTYGQARINSDTATATLLVQSQIKHGTYFPKSWNYVNGSIWTIGLAPVVAPFSLLLSNQSLARMLGSALYVLLTVSGIMYMSKRLFRSDMWTLAIPLFLVFLTGENEHILYQGSNTGNMLWLAVNVTLVFLAVNRSRKFFIPYCIIMIAISTAGIRVYAEQIIPMLSALLLAEFGFNHSSDVVERKRIKRLAENAFFVVFPALIGLLFYKGLCSSHSVNNYAAEFSGNGTVFVNSITECSKNLSLYVTNLFHCFGYNGGVELLSLLGIKNLISIATCCLICFVVPFFQWRSIKNEEQEVKFLFGYALVHNAIILVLVVFFGLTTPRYLLSSLFVNVLVSARYMYAHWLKEKTISRVFWTCAFSLAAIIECIVIISASKGWKGVVDANKSFNRYIAERGLDKGYATYWHAYSNSIYSDLGIEYGAFQIRNARLYEYEWLVDSDTFIPEEKTTF